MFILAWVAVFGLLTLAFDEELESHYNPNQAPNSNVTAYGVEVVLERNRQGHYVTSGTINGIDVVFLVDTGATDVSVPAELAQELGLQGGMGVRLRTANGTVTGYRTLIRELSIGDIYLSNVAGHLNPGMGGRQILLGMSVLKQLEFTQRGDTLILKTL